MPEPELDLGALTGLLGDIVRFVRRYVVASSAQLVVVAVWVVHTHVADLAAQTPYLGVNSPEKGSGKTRLLETIMLLVARPYMAASMSEAAVYRLIPDARPTLLFDEIDTVFSASESERHEGLRAILNAGNRPDSVVWRCVGGSFTPTPFEIYCAKAYAGIGSVPDTLADRSLPIRLKRATRDESHEPFRRRQVEPAAAELRSRIEAWAEDNRDALDGAVPDEAPEGLSDRMQDACEQLFVIADLHRHEWPVLVRRSVVVLCTSDREDSRESVGLRMLIDLRQIFNGHDRLSTDRVVNLLSGVPDAPWQTYKGRGLNAYDLSTLLRAYGVRPRTIRTGGTQTAKGYRRDQLHEAWERYLPPEGANGDE